MEGVKPSSTLSFLPLVRKAQSERPEVRQALRRERPSSQKGRRAVLSQRARLYLCAGWLARRLLVAVHHVNVRAFDLQGPDAFP